MTLIRHSTDCVLTDPQISIIIPLYNETDSFPYLVNRLNAVMEMSSLTIEVVFVDDGSRDNTAILMQQLALIDGRYSGVFLARNYGHQIALTAGMAASCATEALFIIDGDLQDPPELLTEFYEKYQQGYDVVYAIRTKRKENWFKRIAYSSFYRLIRSISYVDIPLDSGDFSLISRRVADILNQMPEESRFIRGMRSWIGFSQIGIEYSRDARIAGEPKYSFKMLRDLAYNGIFNFSEYPIKLVTRLGLFTFCLAMLYLIQTLVKKYYFGDVPQGFTATIFIITLFSSVQLIALGMIGEYVLRIFFQTKGRPLYIVRDVIQQQKRQVLINNSLRASSNNNINQ